MRARFVPLIAASLTALAVTSNAATPTAVTPTFDKDILPILQAHCQQCHRPGEVAPMSLLTYTDARPWAKAMKSAVVTEKMPPWFADPNYGHFANDRRLSKAQIDAISAWADNGAPEGDKKDAPPPRTFQDGWNIKPDMIIEMPKEFHVKAKGTINYQNILVPGALRPGYVGGCGGDARRQSESGASHARYRAATEFDVDGERGSGRGLRGGLGSHGRSRRKAPICSANTIRDWARRASI